MKKRIVALLLTLVMVLSLIPTTVWAASPVQVTFSAQKDGAFLFTRQSVTVTDGLAEEYGYEVSTQDHNHVAIEDPTVFDAMVAVHKAKYGDAFTKETAKNYLDISNGTLSKAFGESATASSFFVNGEMLNDGIQGEYGTTGYLIDAARLKAGDLVEFWFYQDTSYFSDYYTYFTETSKTVPAGEPFTLKLMGFMAMSAMGYPPIPVSIDGTNENAAITMCTINPDGSLGSALKDSGGQELTTNANGEVTLSFVEPGTYIVTASGMAADSFMGPCPIVAPWCAVTVTGGQPQPQGSLDGLIFRKSNSTSAAAYPMTPDFATGTKEYTLSVPDADGPSMYVFPTLTEDAAGKSIHAEWTNLRTGAQESKPVTGKSLNLTNAAVSGVTGNTVTLTIGDNEDAYTVNVVRTPTLKGLSLADSGGSSVALAPAFSPSVTAYRAVTTAERVTLTAEGYDAGYAVTYNGSASGEIELSEGDNPVTVKVTNPTNGRETVYTVTVTRTKAVTVTFTTTPPDAVVMVQDSANTVISPDATGKYSLLGGVAYTYTVTRYGYMSVHEEFTPAADATISVTLTAAPASGLTDVGAAWKNFRNSDVNMAITDARTPKTPETTVLKWAAKLGSGWSAAPSVQIIVDNSLIVMSGTSLYKLNLSDGSIEKQATMVNSPSFGYTPPTYAEGMIFCPLGNGTVQAFNAKTLESLWVYQDPAKGQALSPITYSDGYLYTGFWNNETKDANYVCLSVTDEDPSQENESKHATWTKSVPGGFYWAGSVVVGDVLVVGTDDGAGGTSGTSRLYALNKKNGSEISHLDLTGLGDQRSSIAYSDGRVYFTTKGGYLCSAAVSSGGTLSELKSANMGAQSTSTPIVYQGKVYVCAGSGVVDETIGKGAGHFIVADAATLKTISAVAMKGYPQCSPLLSTAYEGEGYLYFYCTYNANPGGISLIKVKTADQSAELVELYDAAGYEQFCITSVICGADGTLYYKNDSGNVFAVGVSTDAQKAQQVQDQIAAIDTVTLDSENAIKAARTAYDALTDAQKALVNNLSVLTDAEEKLVQLKKEKADQDAADAVIDKIQAVETAVASGDKAAIRQAIRAARTAYNRLTSAQKKLVTNYSVLTEAEKAYPGTSNSTKPGSSTSAGSTVKSSDTGDSSQMTLWMGGCLCSAAAILVLLQAKKRRAR